MTYGKWIWGGIILLVLLYVLNLFGFADTINDLFSSTDTSTPPPPGT